MIIENSRATSRVKLFLIRLPLLLLLILLVLTMMDVFPDALLLIISAGLFLTTLLIVLVGRLHYVSLSFEPSEILIRHYHIFPLISDYQELLIQKSDNPDFELKHTFFGWIPLLHISINTSQGRAVYPPVPLGLFSGSDIAILKKELDIT